MPLAISLGVGSQPDPYVMHKALSTIDCVVKLEKKGERGITVDAKFLHYKEY